MLIEEEVVGALEFKIEDFDQFCKSLFKHHELIIKNNIKTIVNCPQLENGKGGLKSAEYVSLPSYDEKNMIDFAWWLTNNVGQYSDDELAHFNGEYLKKWKAIQCR